MLPWRRCHLVESVTMPRRARSPLAVVCVVAALPAVGLGALAWVANSKVATVSISTDAGAVTVVAPIPLASPLLSVRRAPGTLATDARGTALVAAAAALLGAIDGTSCAALGINDQVVKSVNPDLVVVPASNLKIVVAAVALDVLGPGATFTTQVVGPAPVSGVINGDVYLVGGGDPVLSEAWYTKVTATHKRPPLHATSVEALADALKAAGVTSITGSIIGDGSRYDAETYPPGWSADIRAVADGVPVGALVLNDSTTKAGVIGKDPALAAARAFNVVLKAKGVTVASDSKVGTAPVGAGVLASVQSAPLSDLLNEMLATSDNLTAEMLVKEIGKVVATKATRVDGLAAITQKLTTWGVPVVGLLLADGSGLSRENHLTCSTLMAVLIRGTAGDPVGAGLARAGQDGSTLADYFTKAGLIEVLQGKTGSLKDVKSLSGYFVVGADEVEFVVILNGPTATAFQPIWDQLGAALLAATSAPTADRLSPAATVG